MSVLVVGLNHKSASVPTLERAAIGADALDKLLADLVHLPDVAETFVISTCNRVEVYADVQRFHGAVTGICDLLAQYSGVPASELTASLYVHYEDRAVQHLLAVTSGLDSLVLGEDQIVGQVRSALKTARANGALGRVLGDLGRAALRVGKRARAETGIGRLNASLVSVGIDLAAGHFGTSGAAAQLAGRSVLVVGAGSMSSLSVATAARNGAAGIVVANRTKGNAERVVAGVSGTVLPLDELPGAIAEADLVISCTGASTAVIDAVTVRKALAERQAGRPLVLLDLAMPRDVEAAVGELDGVRVIDMEVLRRSATADVCDDDLTAVRTIIEEEFAAYQSALEAARVAPTVVALRAKAAELVDGELNRLAGRLSDDGLGGHVLDEIAQTVRRVVDKLLHAPTVRVKELAGSPGGEDYAAALRVLFDLNPRAVEAVTRAEGQAPPATDREGQQ